MNVDAQMQISFKSFSKWNLTRHKTVLSCFSCVRLFSTPWAVACQTSLSMGFPRQENWSGSLFLLQGIFLTQGLNSPEMCI